MELGQLHTARHQEDTTTRRMRDVHAPKQQRHRDELVVQAARDCVVSVPKLALGAEHLSQACGNGPGGDAMPGLVQSARSNVVTTTQCAPGERLQEWKEIVRERHSARGLDRAPPLAAYSKAADRVYQKDAMLKQSAPQPGEDKILLVHLCRDHRRAGQAPFQRLEIATPRYFDNKNYVSENPMLLGQQPGIPPKARKIHLQTSTYSPVLHLEAGQLEKLEKPVRHHCHYDPVNHGFEHGRSNHHCPHPPTNLESLPSGRLRSRYRPLQPRTTAMSALLAPAS